MFIVSRTLDRTLIAITNVVTMPGILQLQHGPLYTIRLKY